MDRPVSNHGAARVLEVSLDCGKHHVLARGFDECLRGVKLPDTTCWFTLRCHVITFFLKVYAWLNVPAEMRDCLISSLRELVSLETRLANHSILKQWASQPVLRLCR